MSHKHGDSNFGVYNFILMVKGIGAEGSAVKGWFAEVSGLELDVMPTDYRKGSEGDDKRKMPGLSKFMTITLKRGVAEDIELWNWFINGIRGQFTLANGSIILLNENRQEIMRWNFIRGWPSKCIGPGLNEKSDVIAIETLEIHCEGLNIDD